MRRQEKQKKEKIGWIKQLIFRGQYNFLTCLFCHHNQMKVVAVIVHQL